MEFELTHPLPPVCSVGVSGGVDSMAALHFLNQVPGRVHSVVHVHHNTGTFADEALALVQKVCDEQKIDLATYHVTGSAADGQSREEFWRNQRYRHFAGHSSTMDRNIPIVLAHHLNDCLEEYIMCTMVRGYVGTIPYFHDPCIRPFRLWKREDIHEYARRHGLEWIDDPSNNFIRATRSRIRNRIIPHLLLINPGIYKIAREVIKAQDRHDEMSLEL